MSTRVTLNARGSARALCAAALLLSCWAAHAENTSAPCPPARQPRLLVKLPDICPTPDGMALDSSGDIILACPNYADQTQPAVLLKVDRENGARLLVRVPTLPETGVACPMGIDLGPAGELYVADNQGWVKPNNKGRILRLEIQDGRVARSDVVAYGMSHPNGLRVRGGFLYVTQSLLVKQGDEPLISGVYRFRLEDRNVKVDNTLQDKNLIATFKTLNPAVQYGADGLVFDSRGNLFVGNFGDATIHKLTFDAAQNVASNTIFAHDPCLKSTDGVAIDKDDNLYVADFSGNAIVVISPAGQARVLAKSPDCDGSDGCLDQPGEPLVRGRLVVVSNFDLVTGPDKVNTKHDEPFTMSVIELDR